MLGLPGIVKLEVDLKKDQFSILYNPERISAEQMLEAVRKQGYRGRVVMDSPTRSRVSQSHRDLNRLPEDLRAEVQKAEQSGKLLLLAFHGPG